MRVFHLGPLNDPSPDGCAPGGCVMAVVGLILFLISLRGGR